MPASLSAFLRLVHTTRNRRQVAALAELDDHLLRDIGLERTDVLAALAQPRHRDPSRMLKILCCHGRILVDRLRSGLAPEPAPCC